MHNLGQANLRGYWVSYEYRTAHDGYASDTASDFAPTATHFIYNLLTSPRGRYILRLYALHLESIGDVQVFPPENMDISEYNRRLRRSMPPLRPAEEDDHTE